MNPSIYPKVRRLQRPIIAPPTIHARKAVEERRLIRALHAADCGQCLEDMQRAVGLPFRLCLQLRGKYAGDFGVLDIEGVVGLDIKAIRVLPVPTDGLGLIGVGRWEVLPADDAFGCEVMVELGQVFLKPVAKLY